MQSDWKDGAFEPLDPTSRPKKGQQSGNCTGCYKKDAACKATSDCCSGLKCDGDKQTCG